MIAVRYVIFAVFSTAVNLLAQAIAFDWAPVAPLPTSIACGTVAGFAVKYVLDKHWIFYDRYESADREFWKVLLYGVFSVLTTLIFWATELSFWAIWRTPSAKYAGAVLGLAVGYAAKYGLDRTYVFRRAQA